MNEIIFLAVQLGVAVAAFLIGKYVIPNVPKTAADKLNELSGWAAQFVVWARQFMQSSTGEEKMEKVVEMLNEIAVESGISVTEEQLKAIVQNAYEAMKAGEKELEAITMPVVQEAETAAASPWARMRRNGSAGWRWKKRRRADAAPKAEKPPQKEAPWVHAVRRGSGRLVV